MAPPWLQHLRGFAKDPELYTKGHAALRERGWPSATIKRFFESLEQAGQSTDGIDPIEVYGSLCLSEGLPVGEFEWLVDTHAAIGERGHEALPVPAVWSPEEAAKIAEDATAAMRDGSYYTDPEWRDDYHEALEVLEGVRAAPATAPTQSAAAPSAAAAGTDAARKAELRTMMGDRSSRYWKGDQSAALQAEFRNILARELGDTTHVPTPERSADQARKADLHAMMGDRSSPYWRGDQADALQAEYRQIVTRESSSSPAAGSSPPVSGGGQGSGVAVARSSDAAPASSQP